MGLASVRPSADPVAPSAVTPLALAVADANWYTTEHLFAAAERPGLSTLLLTCMDYRNAWMRGLPPWGWGRPLERVRAGLWRRELVLPSGWMKQFPRPGMRPIRRAIEAWRAQLPARARLGLVMTYPHYLYLRDQVRPDLQVYFNIDDYTHYWPRFAARLTDLEQHAVREADLTVCVSRLRCEHLRRAVPSAAGRVLHLPHGTPPGALAARPLEVPGPAPADLAHFPRPWLGYVGGLEDRVDWNLLTALADAFPAASIILVGRARRLWGGGWQADCRRCLGRPNVHVLGWRPQDRIGAYTRAFDVCLIPYRVDHAFNRASCPTKIMDYMGSSRPIVSTDLPECRLYRDLFDVADSLSAFIDAVRSILARGSDDGRSALRHRFAQGHTCARVADRLLDLLTAPPS